MRPFHLALPVNNLARAVSFYHNTLGFTLGRSSERWQDLNFFGHQVVLHLDENHNPRGAHARNVVDGHGVPVPHFGLVMAMPQWTTFRDRLLAEGVHFEIEPCIRFRGLPGEQATMFFFDPSGNALEFKAMANEANLFAT